MPVFVFILLSLVILLLFSGLLVFVIACVRRKEIQWLVEEEIKNTPYGKHYDKILTGDTFLRENHAQDVYIQSHDGLTLHGSYVPAQKPKGTIILAHGYRSCRLVDFSLAFAFYHDYGMNILVPEQRAHGKSEGRFITFGVKESRDMQAWVDWHNETVGACPVILSGLSMGASTMLYLADADLPENVKSIIADCGYTSPKEIIGSVYRRIIHLPAGPSLWAADLFCRLFAGFSLWEKNTVESLKNSRLPVFLVHGTDDGFVPCEMTRRGYASCRSEKELLLVKGADHGLSFLVDQDRYKQMISAFLDKHLEGNP